MLNFTLLPGSYMIIRLLPGENIPPWALDGSFYSVTRTPDELSIVCSSDSVPQDTPGEGGWSLLKLLGPFPFSTVGVLAEVSNCLSEAGVSLLAISTYDTDYFLVKEDQLTKALSALGKAGHNQK